jgi:hypothetical protein
MNARQVIEAEDPKNVFKRAVAASNDCPLPGPWQDVGDNTWLITNGRMRYFISRTRYGFYFKIQLKTRSGHWHTTDGIPCESLEELRDNVSQSHRLMKAIGVSFNEAEDPKSAFKDRFRSTPWPEDPLILQACRDLGFTVTKRDGRGEGGGWSEYFLDKSARTGSRLYRFTASLTVWQPQPSRVYVHVSRGNNEGQVGTWVNLLSAQVKGVPMALKALRYAMGFIAPKLDGVPTKKAEAQAKAMNTQWLASIQVAEAEDPKSFLQSRHFHFVRARHALWNIDGNGNINYFAPDKPAPGYPMSYKDILDNKYFAKVKKFNMAEYRALHGQAPKEIDISSIGYWLKNGTYVDAERKVSEAEDPKNFLKVVAPQAIVVHCYMGKWDADRKSGMVKRWIPDLVMIRDDLRFAEWAGERVAFDFDEWEKHYGRPADREIDICDIGSWNQVGEYDPPETEYRREQAERDAWQEAEDPKSVFNQLNRPTEVKPEEHMSLTERPWVEDQMYRWSAMWNTPFIIDNRQRIRGCPAGTGTTAVGAVKDLLVRTNRESKTMFYVKIGGDPFPTFARGVIEAESPKQAIRQFTVQHGMQFWTVDADGYIVDSRSVPGTSYDKLRMVAHFDVNDYIDRNGHRPHGTIQLEEIAYWTKYSGQRVPAGMKINYPRRHKNP